MENSKKTYEIWTIETNNETERQVFVLRDKGNVSVVYNLVERMPMEFGCEVICKGRKYINCSQPGYAFSERFSEYIRTASEAEIEMIRGTIAEAFGFDLTPQALPPVVKEYKKIPENVGNNVITDTDLRMQICSAETERDVYKGLFEKFFVPVGRV